MRVKIPGQLLLNEAEQKNRTMGIFRNISEIEAFPSELNEGQIGLVLTFNDSTSITLECKNVTIKE